MAYTNVEEFDKAREAFKKIVSLERDSGLKKAAEEALKEVQKKED